jgi:hypothetical protein
MRRCLALFCALIALIALVAGSSAPAGAATLKQGKGWVQLAPTFTRCTTITWTYTAKREPTKAAGMASDVASAFRRISAATGIRFKQVSSGGRISIGWQDLGTGEDGQGGPTWRGDTAVSAQVTFNIRSGWVGVPGFGHRKDGFPGRGGLITHEVAHALGLGHVDDRRQIMYPVATNGSPTVLQAGDVAGLKALYRASSC